MSEAPTPVSALRRLHPATVIVKIPTVLRSMALPLVAVFVASSADETSRNLLWFAGIAGGTSVIASIFRYVFTYYGIADDKLVIRTGMLFRRDRTIPIARIQNIDLKRTPLHRLMGVTEVRVETAGAEGSEAHLSVVGVSQAELFRSDLLDRAGRTSHKPGGPVPQVLRSSSLGELLLAGATENRVGVIVAGIFGLLEFAGDAAEERVKQTAKELAHELPGIDWANQIVVAVAVALAFLLAGWLVSITLTLIRYHGFTLSRLGDELRCAYGLLTRHEAVVPLVRLQVLRLESNVLHRLAGLNSVTADTAGAADENTAGGAVTLSPLMPRSETAAFSRAVLPHLRLDDVPLQPVSPLAVRRGFIRFCLLGTLLLTPLAFALDPAPALLAGAAPVFLLAAYALARWRYSALRWHCDDEFLFARAGMWTRRMWIVPQEKVQSVSVSSSPFQRRLGLATLHVATAGAGERSNAVVVDLEQGLAERLRDSLSLTSNASGLLRGGI